MPTALRNHTPPRRGLKLPHALRYLGYYLRSLFRPVAPAPRKPDPSRWSDENITLAWLGHATVLINFYGVKILTDPALGARIGILCGPLVLGPKRYLAAALNPRELPRIDVILLTHAHMDHFDFWTLRRLDRNATVVTARETADLLITLRFKKVMELDWGAAAELETNRGCLRIAAFKTRHWGARRGRDVYRGYNGYLIERNGRRICIAGDTARTDFSHVARLGPIDLIVFPIGAYNPWIHSHCTPEEAVEMANEAGTRFILPIHHQTFKLSWEPLGEPIERFKKALANQPERIAAVNVGETFVLP